MIKDNQSAAQKPIPVAIKSNRNSPQVHTRGVDLKSKYKNIIIIIAVCIIAELLFANRAAIGLKLGGAQEAAVDLSSVEVSELFGGSGVTSDGISLQKGTLKFKNVGSEMRNLCIETKDGNYHYTNVNITFTDENFALEDGAWRNNFKHRLYLGDREKNYFNISSYGNVGTLKLEFENETAVPFMITAITFNSPPPFHFSVAGFTLMAVICLSVYCGAWKWKTKKKDSVIFLFLAFVMCVVVMAVTFTAASTSGKALVVDFPLEDKYTGDQYQQLFSSFSEGRLDINVDHVPAQFTGLSDPYDISERDHAGLSGDFWDRAYYKGKFYSYFGVAPVFTIYLPVFILTGKLPTAMLASSVATCYAMIFMSLLYVTFLKKFCKDVPLILALLGQLALIFGSLILPLNAEEVFYSIAAISGIGSLSAFLYFLLTAYYEENFRKRIVLLALSGISVVMIACSRPSLLIYCTAALVPAVFIFSGKADTIGKKAAYACSIGVPVALGAAGLMIYNYLRFSSPFEFGFTYQLTVSEAAANTLTLAYIPAAIYHYFLQMPAFDSRFPYIDINWTGLPVYPRYTFVYCSVGALAFPASWGIFLLPAVDKKKDKFKTAFILTFLFSAILLSFIDMCKAGILYRYTADILTPILFVGLITLFDIINMLEKAPKRVYATAYIIAAFALAVTIAEGYLFIFSNEYEIFINDYAALTEILRNL